MENLVKFHGLSYKLGKKTIVVYQIFDKMSMDLKEFLRYNQQNLSNN